MVTTRAEARPQNEPEPRQQRRIDSEESRRQVILVVEDDAGDRELIGRAFEECVNDVELKFVEDGTDALCYLFLFRPYDAVMAPRPSLILLDLDIPKVRGERILKDIRDDSRLHTIPVVVFTGSENADDVHRAYALGANSYFTKPVGVDGYRKVMRILESYWLRRAELPPRLD
jgi:CheY-like chemotaxis protein